jgi:hypothetical protein
MGLTQSNGGTGASVSSILKSPVGDSGTPAKVVKLSVNGASVLFAFCGGLALGLLLIEPTLGHEPNSLSFRYLASGFHAQWDDLPHLKLHRPE